MGPSRLILSTLALTASLLTACGAGNKIDDGGERVERSIDKSVGHGKREVHELFSDDAGAADARR